MGRSSKSATYCVHAHAERNGGTRANVLEALITTRWTRACVVLLLVLEVFGAIFGWSWWIGLHAETGWPALDIALSGMSLLACSDMLFVLAMLLRAKRIRRDIPPPGHFKVAMVVTKAPSEPWEVVERTLMGMLNQDYPHAYDVWLADEAPCDATRVWCKDHGVNISTRQGVKDYHQPTWPRRTRCKEGNLAYFYDHYGYDRYDVVCQFDADHVPEPGYLRHLMPAFLDSEVGYIALPSICDANKDVSWAVRGRLHFEGFMHGAQGAICTKIALPYAIGSHYAVRTSMLKQAGGIGPELDEDFSTSYIMTSHGFKGVFAIDSIAHGDGPVTFEDCMYQEYQWARSAMVLVTCYLGRWWPGHLTLMEKYREVRACMTWPQESFKALLGMLVVLGPCLWGLQLVPALDYGLPASTKLSALYSLPKLCLAYGLWQLSRHNGWLRPVDSPFLTWEKWLHCFARPFWMLQGTVHGLLGGALGINFNIKVTRKGKGGVRLMGPNTLAPFLICAAASVVALARGSQRFLLPLTCCLYHLAVATAVVVLHYKENHLPPHAHSGQPFPWRNLLQLTAPLLALLTALCCVLLQRHEVVFRDIWLGQAAYGDESAAVICAAGAGFYNRLSNCTT